MGADVTAESVRAFLIGAFAGSVVLGVAAMVLALAAAAVISGVFCVVTSGLVLLTDREAAQREP